MFLSNIKCTFAIEKLSLYILYIIDIKEINYSIFTLVI